MVKRPRIRLDRPTKKEYQRLVKNTKSKIRRMQNKYGVDLTDDVEIPKLEDFETRKQFNEFKDEQKSFTNRRNKKYQFKKNKYDVVASKEEIERAEEMTKQNQENAKKYIERAKDKPFVSGGKEQSTVGQQMKQMGKPNAGGVYVPNDFNFKDIKTRRALDVKLENIEKRADEKYYDKRMETMKENFMDILELSYHSDAKNLVDELKDIPAEHFYEMYMMFDEFDFDLYDSEGQFVAPESNVSQMLDYIDRYYRDGMNFDLMKF